MPVDSFSLKIEAISTDEIASMIASTSDIFTEYSDKVRLRDYAAKLSKYANFVTVRNEQEQIVSIIAFYSNNPEFCYISFVCVLPEYKRKGLSQSMLVFLENYVRNIGITLIKLEVRKNNPAAINAYQKYGFYILDDTSLDSCFMCKQIDK